MKIDKAKAIREAELEDAEERGIEKGRKEVQEEAREIARKELLNEKHRLAVNFLKMGISVEQVSEATGLDIELVRKLKEK